MAEWTTGDVRALMQYAFAAFPNPTVGLNFDEWLAAHDAEVRARALEEAAAIAEALDFGPAPAFSRASAHRWGALKAAERIRGRAKQEGGDRG